MIYIFDTSKIGLEIRNLPSIISRLSSGNEEDRRNNCAEERRRVEGIKNEEGNEVGESRAAILSLYKYRLAANKDAKHRNTRPSMAPAAPINQPNPSITPFASSYRRFVPLSIARGGRKPSLSLCASRNATKGAHHPRR